MGMAQQAGNDDARDRAPGTLGSGTVMRHYLRRSFAPTSLAGRMPTGSLMRLLVPRSGSAKGFTPALGSAFRVAILVSSVASATDAHLLPTARAAVESI